MKKKLILALIIPIILSAGNTLFAHERTWPAKRLKNIYPEATKFTSKQVTLTARQIARIQEHKGIKIGVEDKSPTFYFAHRKIKIKKKEKKKTELMGVIIFIDEIGAKGKMEITVGMTPKGKIDRMDLWKHKEDKRITGKKFLKQFKGKGVHFDFHPGHTVKLVKEAEKASLAVMRAAQKALLIMDEVYRKKKKKKQAHHKESEKHEHKKGEKKDHHKEEKLHDEHEDGEEEHED